MGRNREILDTLISELDEIQEIRGCIMISQSGEIVASKLDRDMDEEKLGSMTKDMVDTFGKLETDCNFQSPAMVVIEGSDGKMAAVNIGPDLGYLFLFGNPEMSLGMVKMTINNVTQKSL